MVRKLALAILLLRTGTFIVSPQEQRQQPTLLSDSGPPNGATTYFQHGSHHRVADRSGRGEKSGKWRVSAPVAGFGHFSDTPRLDYHVPSVVEGRPTGLVRTGLRHSYGRLKAGCVIGFRVPTGDQCTVVISLKGTTKMTQNRKPTAEDFRLEEDARREKNWKRWGPYLADRQWGTVREDYSPDGECWEFFPHEHARSRAYRWGEDGLLGITDRQCRLCFGLALWNGRDAMLKERLFGLNNHEGNHGEDVKECYFYIDSTPTHSYMKALYKYPQADYPYARLVEENRRRSRLEPEFELLDTGVFDDNHYFDLFVEYAKAAPNDLLIRITVANRGPQPARLYLLPTLWFRNTWSWGCQHEGC